MKETAEIIKDADIREPLCLFLEEAFGKVRFFDELTMGKSRADLVLVTDAGLYGVEIKSDADTYTRLPRQVKDYDRFFDFNLIVVGSTHALHAGEHVPGYWGIVSVESMNNSLDFYTVRQPKRNPKVNLKNQIRLLWRRELAQIQKAESLYKYAGKSRSFVEKYLLERLPQDVLKHDLLEVLFDRDYSEFL